MTASICVSENLIVGDDGLLRLAPWSQPQHVVDEIARSGADGKLMETQSLPGKLLITKQVQWTNDTPVAHQVCIRITRRHRFWITSNPNAVQFRDRWATAITPKGSSFVTPADPLTSGIYNGQVGSAEDTGTNTVAEPNPGKYYHWWGTTSADEWSDPVEPGDTLALWYKMFVWTPPPFSDNANKNNPVHFAEAGYSRIEMIAHPDQGKLVAG